MTATAETVDAEGPSHWFRIDSRLSPNLPFPSPFPRHRTTSSITPTRGSSFSNDLYPTPPPPPPPPRDADVPLQPHLPPHAPPTCPFPLSTPPTRYSIVGKWPKRRPRNVSVSRKRKLCRRLRKPQRVQPRHRNLLWVLLSSRVSLRSVRITPIVLMSPSPPQALSLPVPLIQATHPTITIVVPSQLSKRHYPTPRPRSPP